MKHENIRLADAYTAPDARFHAATLRTLRQIQQQNSHHTASIPLRAALIAAALLLALTAIGFATGTFQSIFSHMSGAWAGGSGTDYVHMEEAAAQNVFTQTLDFPNGAQATVSLEQSYYNGEQLTLGWSLRPEGEFAWLYEKEDPAYADLHPETEEFINEDGHINMVYHGFSGDLSDLIGTELADEFHRRLREDGWAGVAWYDCYMGDGVSLPGVSGEIYFFDGSIQGTTEDAHLDLDEILHWKQSATHYAYQKCGALPDAAQNLDALNVKTHAFARLRWYCEDSSGRYYGSTAADMLEVLADIPRSESFEAHSYSADMAFHAHTAHIDLRTTPIYTEFTVESTLPEEWVAVWRNPENFPDDKMPLEFPADVFYRYEFYAEIDGELQALPVYDWIDEYPFRGDGTFALPSGATALHVRPVYYNSGAHSDEDFVISL